MKQVEVTIMGHGYILGCPDGGETMLTQAVASVDKEMSNIRDSGKVIGLERIAIMAAINITHDYLSSKPIAPDTREHQQRLAQMGKLLDQALASQDNLF